MTLEEFKASLTQPNPPNSSSKVLQALWYDAKGDWDTAHQLAQSLPDTNGAWVHAYLHRKEGDLSNAAYWYAQTNRRIPNLSLQTEWEQMVVTLL
jgi:hypothetical protein